MYVLGNIYTYTEYSDKKPDITRLLVYSVIIYCLFLSGISRKTDEIFKNNIHGIQLTAKLISENFLEFFTYTFSVESEI